MSAAAKDAPLAVLDDELIAAHAVGDMAGMARLYHQAGQQVLALGRDAEAAFLLTQAYVLSLDCGDWPRAAECHRQLVAMGRER